MTPEEFAHTAGVLTAMGGPYPQGRGRSAVSRYYYAAFLEAKDRLSRDRSFKFKKHGSHENVSRCFRFSDETPLILIGRLLEDLKKLRVEADYDLVKDLDVADTAEAKRMCEDIQAALAAADLTGCKDYSK